ncbi:MAG: oligogalacturonate lyase family protein [Christensenellales bacterium]
MKTVRTSSHFSEYKDPVTGVRSYLLSTRVAPQQQGFYFVNPSMSKDGRYLWFMCSHPPANQRYFSVVDFLKDEVYAFPETAGPTESGLVLEETGELIFANGQGLYKRSPDPQMPLEKLFPVPEEIAMGALPVSLCTHLTLSADGQELFLDSMVGGDNFVIGSINIYTGKYTEWYRPDFRRNHAQFHPTDKDLVLFAEDHYIDPVDGSQRRIRTNSEGVYMRLWTMRRGDKEPALHRPMGNYATHEFWSPDGKWMLYCNAAIGICGKHMETGEEKVFHTVPPWHCYCTKDMGAFVSDVVLGSDGFYRGCPSRVEFFNAKTGKAVDIVSYNPAYNTKAKSNIYHTDPHPRFVGDDKYIVSTSTVSGKLDLLVTPVDELFEITA